MFRVLCWKENFHIGRGWPCSQVAGSLAMTFIDPVRPPPSWLQGSEDCQQVQYAQVFP